MNNKPVTQQPPPPIAAIKNVKVESPKQVKKLKKLTYILVAAIILILASTSIVIIANKGKKPGELEDNKTETTGGLTPTASKVKNTEWKTYTNLQYGFQFRYPPEFSSVGKDQSQPGFIPVCSPGNLFCVSYAHNPYPESNFEAAGFSIQVIPNISDEVSCATYSFDQQNPQKLENTKLINGYKFYYGTNSGAATGHQNKTVSFRTYHSQTCFELDQSISTSSCEENSPELCPNKFTEALENTTFATFDQMLSTFKFSGDKQDIVQKPGEREKDGCVISGCSSEICSDKVKFSTCEVKPGAECYKSAICERQKKGECAWTMSEELSACLSEKQ